MPFLFLRLKKKSDNVFLQSILGTYSHLMWVRTEDPKQMLVKVITTDDLLNDSIKVLERLREEIPFDFISS